jgi:hypothetical protein
MTAASPTGRRFRPPLLRARRGLPMAERKALDARTLRYVTNRCSRLLLGGSDDWTRGYNEALRDVANEMRRKARAITKALESSAKRKAKR